MRLAPNPSLREASCCNVEVVNGGNGWRRTSRCSTEATVTLKMRGVEDDAPIEEQFEIDVHYLKPLALLLPALVKRARALGVLDPVFLVAEKPWLEESP